MSRKTYTIWYVNYSYSYSGYDRSRPVLFRDKDVAQQFQRAYAHGQFTYASGPYEVTVKEANGAPLGDTVYVITVYEGDSGTPRNYYYTAQMSGEGHPVKLHDAVPTLQELQQPGMLAGLRKDKRPGTAFGGLSGFGRK